MAASSLQFKSPRVVFPGAMIPCICQETVQPGQITIYSIQILTPIAYTRSAAQTHPIFLYVSISFPSLLRGSIRKYFLALMN